MKWPGYQEGTLVEGRRDRTAVPAAGRHTWLMGQSAYIKSSHHAFGLLLQPIAKSSWPCRLMVDVAHPVHEMRGPSSGQAQRM